MALSVVVRLFFRQMLRCKSFSATSFLLKRRKVRLGHMLALLQLTFNRGGGLLDSFANEPNALQQISELEECVLSVKWGLGVLGNVRSLH